MLLLLTLVKLKGEHCPFFENRGGCETLIHLPLVRIIHSQPKRSKTQ